MAKPLAGYRILDLTWVIAGPLTTKILAASGAEVIKVETSRTRGNASREMYGIFLNNNSDKFSINLNLKHPQGKDIFRKLVAISDVVIDNFSPDVMPNLGFSYKELAAIKPDIITVSMPGLGSSGPWRNFQGPGSLYSAMAGLDEFVGYPHRDLVDPPAWALNDAGANPLHTTTAILAALHHRKRTGKGQHIELRQLESTLGFLGVSIMAQAANKDVETRMGSRLSYAAPHGVYRCQGDDRWCAISVLTEQEWRSFCSAVEHPEWAEDPRFSTLIARKCNEDALDTLVQEWTVGRTQNEVLTTLQTHRIPSGSVQNIDDLLHKDPQLAHRGFYHEIEHPDEGTIPHEGLSFRLSTSPVSVDKPAPQLGEHTAYILQNLLDITEAEFDELIIAGAIYA